MPTGTLFIVVGNSGSGKDSLIREALARLPESLQQRLHQPQRYITRPPHETEPFISVTPEEFAAMSQRGDFCLEWHIYGLAYGVPANIREILDRGDHVLLNISRDVIPEARRKFARSRVVFVQVPFEVTLARIKSRGREAEDDPVFLERVERARQKQELPGADFVVDNSGPLEVGGQALMEYLRQEMLSSD